MVKTKFEDEICIKKSDCSACDLGEKLLCRCHAKDVRVFVFSQLPYFFFSFVGMILVAFVTNVWWPILAYSVVGIAFLGPVEMWVLCRHCPQYAKDERMLHCIAPNPFPKLFSYSPDPLNVLENVVLVAFASYLLAFPSFAQAYGVWFLSTHREFGHHYLSGLVGLNLATIVSATVFYIVLRSRFCSRCVNLSCPFNKVSEDVAAEFLEKNPIMKDAWIETHMKPGQAPLAWSYRRLDGHSYRSNCGDAPHSRAKRGSPPT